MRTIRNYLTLLVLLCLIGCPCDEYDKLTVTSQTTVVIGDSIFVANDGNCLSIPKLLSLGLSTRINSFAIWGSTFSPTILNQYQKIQEYQTIIVDGGANDLLQECAEVDRPLCIEVVDKIVYKISSFISTRKTEGKKVIFIGYYDMAGFMLPVEQAKRDVMALIKGRFPSEYLDLRTVFQAHPEYIATDGVHPSPAGSKRIAEEILTRLN